MEIAHAQRDHMTRDFHNKIDTSRQRDSGLQGMIPKGDPAATAHKWRATGQKAFCPVARHL